ncbi:beta-galactosidase [Natranaerovirga pectinivora]|uniref:Beta-galactosidase n=1 Tax=Natranaerovirga pectinivora TaxID=682400 RepID=A0A4R3MLF8_9FIRM|nr:glycoside hydrolase family 2 TIM barrel-domain containing protein [Natranaerovirga pectinivora]TCT15536.1 beta-galactosidase [Natranaerovirga pectinivora]
MRKQYSLNKGWRFDKATEGNDKFSGYLGQRGVEINLPHTWNTGTDNFRGLCMYQKVLKIEEEHQKDHIFLEFLGANSVCRVYLNDKYIGEHRGGYSTFRFDITQVYDWKKENILRVYVDNGHTNDVSPLMGDFTIYGGLYRSVNLICVPSSHFDLLFYGSDGVILQSEVDENDNGVLNIDCHVVNGEDLFLEMEVLDAEGIVVIKSESLPENRKQTLIIKKCEFWNGKSNPYLYQLTATLRSEQKIYDQVKLPFGFRQCHLNSETGFILNNEPMKINGVAKHQDFSGVGNAITSEHINKSFELIEEIGANALRLSHYQHAQEVYDLCDQLGYVTWAEIPMMSMPNHEGVLDNAKEQLMELVYQNCHHPSICFWGIQNEIAMGGESLAMYKGVHELNDLFHTIMPNGISASANMYYVKNPSPLNFITDMLGYNLYYGWYYEEIEKLDEWFDQFHKENPGVNLGMSEYGADSNLAFHSDNPKVKDYSEEFQSLYHEKTYAIIESKPYLWGSFVWNMFDFGSDIRDEGGTKGKNCKGLITFDREIKKDAFYFYKAKWSDKFFVHICEKRYVNRSDEEITVKVYSNLKNVTLFINDVQVGSLEGETIFSFKNVPLQKGDNKVVVIANQNGNEYQDMAVFVRKDTKDESYVFVDPNPGLNVENWFTQEKGELDFFPEGYYSIKDKIGDLMESKEAWRVLEEKVPQVVKRSSPGSPITLMWVFDKMRNHFSEEAILEINSQLIKIPKK